MSVLGNYSRTEIIHSVLITIGSFVLFVISFGITQSFGVIYVYLLDEFKETRTDTSWIASLGSGLMLSFGPISGVILKKYGLRFTTILGSVLASSGLLSSFFVKSMYFLYLTYGVVTGIGFSLMFNSTNISLNVYFTKRRYLAAGIATTGSSFGTITLPILGSYLLQSYGWRGTFLILSGIVLQGTCSGMLFSTHTSSTDNIKAGNKPHVTKDPQKREGILSEIKEIFLSKQFILFSISSSFVALFFFVPYVMLPAMVKDNGISEESGALMITVSGITNVISRMVFGYVSHSSVINRFVLNGAALIILGVSTSLCYIVQVEYLYYIYASVVGITLGIFGIFQTLLAFDILGKEKVELGFGFQSFFNGICIVAGPPIAGFITDRTGSYKLAFLCGGFVFCMGGLFSIMASYEERCCSYSKKHKLPIHVQQEKVPYIVSYS